MLMLHRLLLLLLDRLILTIELKSIFYRLQRVKVPLPDKLIVLKEDGEGQLVVLYDLCLCSILQRLQSIRYAVFFRLGIGIV